MKTNSLDISSPDLMVKAAKAIFLFIIEIRNSPPLSIKSIKNSSLTLINEFEQKLLTKNIPNQKILAARYCLCTFIDETILQTPWGQKSEWAKKPLLSHFYEDTLGGDRFYLIADYYQRQPINNEDILKLILLTLNLGYQGKLFENENIMESKKEKLKMIIRAHEKKGIETINEKKDIHLKNDKNTLKFKKFLLVFIPMCIATTLLANYKIYVYSKFPLKIIEAIKNGNH